MLNYVAGDITYKFNYGMSSESKSAQNDAFSMMALEAAYALDKQTTLYGSFAQITNDARSKAGFVGSGSKVTPQAIDKDPTAITFGIRYNF